MKFPKVWFAPINCSNNSQETHFQAIQMLYDGTLPEGTWDMANVQLQPIIAEYLRRVADVQRDIVQEFGLELLYEIKKFAATYD